MKTISRLISALFVCCFAVADTAYSQTLDIEMTRLAEKISKSLAAQGYKNVAAIDFTDLQGQPTELGRLLSERLVVEIVSAGGVSMVDRANIKNILAEHKLTESGLVNPANAKKLGEFAGVDVILTGNATALDSGVELLVKAISTETSKLVAAGRITFPMTSDIQILLNRSVSSNGSSGAGETIVTNGGHSTQASLPLATKDIGSLRIVLRSLVSTTMTDQSRRKLSGITCSFEFINRETKKDIVVALNAENEGHAARRAGITFGSSSPVPSLLRSGALDDRGSKWNLEASNLIGVGFVIAGVHGHGGGLQAYSPYEIVKLLRLRDELGRDAGDPADGAYTTDTTIGEGGYNTVYGRSNVPMNFVSFGNTFIAGSTTAIEPGQSVSVTMDFRPARENSPAPTSFQVSMEIVIGVVGRDAKYSYSLKNVVFDHVSLSAEGVK